MRVCGFFLKLIVCIAINYFRLLVSHGGAWFFHVQPHDVTVDKKIYIYIKRKFKTTATMPFNAAYFTINEWNYLCCFSRHGYVRSLFYVFFPTNKLGSDTVMPNASSGSWREGKLDLRDAPLLLCCDAVPWMHREKLAELCPVSGGK